MYAYVGCYTTPDRDGRGEGIGVYQVDPQSGAWTQVQLVGEVANPSFLAIHPEQHTLYCVHGGNDHSEVSAFAIEPGAGRLTLLNTEPTGGTNPVSVAVDPSGRLVAVANYTGGLVASLPIAADGTLGPAGAVLEQTGEPGPHPTEQASAHPHHLPFDPNGHFLVAPDKGLDRLFIYRPEVEDGALVPHDPPSVATHRGAGPRHIAFHPNAPYAYVINELNSTITAYDYDAAHGTLQDRETISSLPPDFAGDNTGSEIAVAPSGRFLYASNRGHDSIGIFAIEPTTGALAPVGWEPTQGKTPRFFALDPSGTFLYAANQASDTIVAFRVDPNEGTLAATGQVIESGSPSCVVFGR
jgi:6-phosphogluconolactonase (cycloisomerase 2 family)